MIKVGIVSPKLSGFGGTETVLNSVVSSNSLKSKYKFELFFPDGLNEFDWLSDKKNKIVNYSGKNRIHYVMSILNYYIKTKNDIILVLGPRQIFIANLIRKIFHKKYKIVSWIHFSIFGTPDINPKYLKYADFHLAICTEIKEQLKKLGILDNKIFVIYNPVKSISRESILQNRQEISKSIDFAYVGRLQLYQQKNIAEMLDGLKLFNTDNHNWTLSLVGSGQVSEIKKYASKLDIEEHLNFLGWQKNPWKVLKGTDVVLLSSNYEGFGMVLAESISHGIPVVSVDCSVGPKDIVNRDNGLLYRQGDSTDLRTKLEQVIGDKRLKNIDKVVNSIDFLYDKKYIDRFDRALYKILITR